MGEAGAARDSPCPTLEFDVEANLWWGVGQESERPPAHWLAARQCSQWQPTVFCRPLIWAVDTSTKSLTRVNLAVPARQ